MLSNCLKGFIDHRVSDGAEAAQPKVQALPKTIGTMWRLPGKSRQDVGVKMT